MKSSLFIQSTSLLIYILLNFSQKVNKVISEDGSGYIG